MYKKEFRLNTREIDIIEDCLRQRVSHLAMRIHDAQEATIHSEDSAIIKADMALLREIKDLLGEIHNQKIWYHPKENVPLG
ncbi:MAG: hypothetical protein NXI21_10050 [Alphaproteobacteria bacterium]|nr:hypothetical protein [Alphaproteobacteria bacterium]